jgi:hypothetical protein
LSRVYKREIWESLVKYYFQVIQGGKGQMNQSRLISFQEAGQLLGGLHANTLRQRKGGSENLTHVTGFGRRVMLIREEVEALVQLRIAQAQASERDRQKMLRLVS